MANLNPEFNAKLIIITFAGRERYMKILSKYVNEIMERLPNSEWHLWDFSRNSSDHEYIKKFALNNPGVKYFGEFYLGPNQNVNCIKRPYILCDCAKCRIGDWREPYLLYGQEYSYSNNLYLKLDDDIVYVQVDKIETFLNTAKTSESILSANVINNGVCAQYFKALRDSVERGQVSIDRNFRNMFFIGRRTWFDWWLLCTSKDFFFLAHDFFFSNFLEIQDMAYKLRKLPKGRFSINSIAFNQKLMNRISAELSCNLNGSDEEVISKNFKITVMEGFTTSHLHFSDQRASLTDFQEEMYLNQYSHLASSKL